MAKLQYPVPLFVAMAVSLEQKHAMMASKMTELDVQVTV